MNEIPDIRQDRVATIKAAIADGTYETRTNSALPSTACWTKSANGDITAPAPLAGRPSSGGTAGNRVLAECSHGPVGVPFSVPGGMAEPPVGDRCDPRDAPVVSAGKSLAEGFAAGRVS